MSKETTTAIAIADKFKTVAEKLNSNVYAVIGGDKMNGFHQAYLVATATDEIRKLLTDEYMKPIMALQGNKLGFKTDRDDKGGYEMAVVRNCLIEAVLTGVQPTGNQFNIIAGNMYVTKEGFGHLLKNTKGLSYKLVPGLPRVNSDKNGAAVTMKVKYTFNGKSEEEELDIPIKMNQYMGVDGLLGKATRKARAWLFNTVNDAEVADGDVIDTTAEVLANKIEKKENKENAVAGTMAAIAQEAKEKVSETSPVGDPSKLTDEEKAQYGSNAGELSFGKPKK